MGGMAGARLLVRLAFRSLWSHKGKTLTVGSLVFFGTMLVVVGTALLDSIEFSMSRSIISSLSGHIQIYDADAKDDLALFGSGFMGADDIGEIDTFAPVKAALEGIDTVDVVVPMGLGRALTSEPNEIDRVLNQLRVAVTASDKAAISTLATQVRTMGHELEAEYGNIERITSDSESVTKAKEALATIKGDEFWAGLQGEEPESTLQYLETRIAPLASDGRMFYVGYVGTDLTAFAEHFDRFKVIEGEMVPDGQRGILLSGRTYERYMKHKIARDLDRIQRKREGGMMIVDDPLLTTYARGLSGQYQRVTFQLTPDDGKLVEARLREELPAVEGGLNELVQELLRVDDSNFDVRYALFYELIAPRIRLHPVDVGDVITLRAMTEGGYLKAVNVKLWGIFQFQGLETSDMAGAKNLADIVTFRELYGQMTGAVRGELADIKASVGLEAVAANDVEAALFGDEDDDIDDESSDTGFDEFAEVDLSGQVARLREAATAPFDQAQIDQGLALNAAVLLRDATKLQETLAEIRAVVERDGLSVQATDWQTASGMVGQFITVVRLVLYIAIFIIFTVAIVIINNSMIIATMERVSEIGTMRAIGAQRSFVLAMFLLETLALGLVAGGAGGVAGAGVVSLMGHYGLSAGGVDIMVFLFSGPSLFPTVGLTQLAIGLAVIVTASVASTLYPAMIATRIQPVVAMQAEG